MFRHRPMPRNAIQAAGHTPTICPIARTASANMIVDHPRRMSAIPRARPRNHNPDQGIPIHSNNPSTRVTMPLKTTHPQLGNSSNKAEQPDNGKERGKQQRPHQRPSNWTCHDEQTDQNAYSHRARILQIGGVVSASEKAGISPPIGGFQSSRFAGAASATGLQTLSSSSGKMPYSNLCHAGAERVCIAEHDSPGILWCWVCGLECPSLNGDERVSISNRVCKWLPLRP